MMQTIYAQNFCGMILLSFYFIRFLKGLIQHFEELIKISHKKSMGHFKFNFRLRISWILIWIVILFIKVVIFQACFLALRLEVIRMLPILIIMYSIFDLFDLMKHLLLARLVFSLVYLLISRKLFLVFMVPFKQPIIIFSNNLIQSQSQSRFERLQACLQRLAL